MKNNIDSKILKVMNLAIKYIGKLTEEDLDKLIKGDSTFLVTDKHKNRRVKEVESQNDWSNEIKKLNEFNTFYNRVVELVCTQNGSKNLQVYSYSHFYIYRLILILLCLILYVKLLLIRLFKKLNLLVVRSFVILLVIISIKFLFFISIHLLASL